MRRVSSLRRHGDVFICACLFLNILLAPPASGYVAPLRRSCLPRTSRRHGVQMGLVGDLLQPIISPSSPLRHHLTHAASLIKDAIVPSTIPASASYLLTRQVFLRGLGLVYAVAFLVALQQNKALLGDKGILPVRSYLDRWERSIHGTVRRQARGKQSGIAGALASWGRCWKCFWEVPTLLWFVRRDKLDVWMRGIAGFGLFLSLVLLGCGTIPALGAFSLWLLYQSIVNVGQAWYSFGWESQLLETGLLAVFLCPLWSLDPFKATNKVSRAVVWAYRWLLFRIMLGAGLIKMRGGEEWRDLTAMDYFYETQPVPSPLSYYLHQSPRVMHKFEVLVNHLVELVGPWLLLLPYRAARVCGGVVQLVFQAVLISAGNLSFLNWLTALPALWCLDDQFLADVLRPSASTLERLLQASLRDGASSTMVGFRLGRDVALILSLAYLSCPVVQNLLSSRQTMNRSYDRFHLCNTYGAFGTVTKERYEVIFQGASKYVGDDTVWREYHFRVKPGPTKRRPPIITPYHYRLDWLAWFLPFSAGSYQYPRWLISFLGKLAENDPHVTALLEANPFEGQPQGPRYLRAQLYRYRFTRMGSEEARAGEWWVREEVGSYFPMRSAEDVGRMLSSP